ncbi:hypothetical protein H9L13_02905 [Sphingomonas lutea]|uniref:Core-binding (CB) domain-containing protein n=1 Tax=Sphingomonas lutea TaxID=1045317 RepID=A0A7G9SJ63_9SPHN|nr:hypothetical protein [Sphingomonas lutea]QNN67888.1 hypothetical protein H9L13_02905 [Sphingomonas lutea]
MDPETYTLDVRDPISRYLPNYPRIRYTNERAGLPLNQRSPGPARHARFDELARDFLEAKRGDLSDREWRNIRNLIGSNNGPVRFFEGRLIHEISTGDIREYLEFAEARSTRGKLSPFTLRRHLSAVSGILRLAVERRLITTLPPLPRIKAKDAPRGWFSAIEYRRLCSTAHSLAQIDERVGRIENAADWHELGDLVALLVNCFLRPGEWKYLRHRHVTVDRIGPTPHLLIALERSKTGARAVASMPSAVKIYDRIVARSGCQPDDFLLLNRYSNRQTAQDKMWHLFRRLLRETGLGLDRYGRTRTLYSLRHTSLMLRLLKGENLDLLTLARAAGTSVPMLERFYLSHHTSALKLGALQSFKRDVANGSPASLRSIGTYSAAEGPKM